MRRFCDAQVRRYLEENPRIAREISDAGVTIVAFELPTHTDALFADAQAELDRCEAALGPRDRPVFVALRTRRGPFLGYSAVGEGGVAFFDAAGEYTGNSPDTAAVRAALRWRWVS